MLRANVIKIRLMLSKSIESSAFVSKYFVFKLYMSKNLFRQPSSYFLQNKYFYRFPSLYAFNRTTNK